MTAKHRDEGTSAHEGLLAEHTASQPRDVCFPFRADTVTRIVRRSLASGAMALVCAACSGTSSGPDDSDPTISLSLVAGTCAIERFEVLTAVPPYPVEFDAAANGYQGTLTIRATSRTAGSWTLAATARDNLRLGEVGSGTLTLVQPDTLLFQGSTSLPGKTHFEVAGPLLTLLSTSAHSVTIPAGTIQALTRIACRS